MSLNIGALSIVKAVGLGYPAAQIVFLRAIVGLGLILPWAVWSRSAFTAIPDPKLQILRVVLSALALSAAYFAVSRVPFALFTALSFTRPIVLMLMASLFLAEVIGPRRRIAALVALGGVIIAVGWEGFVVNLGVGAVALAVIFGTSAIILTRKLAATPTVVLMVFYTGGLSVLAFPIATSHWVPIPSDHLLPLLAIGVFAQAAQFCFLQAHTRAEASFLAMFGYLSLILTTAVGFFVFGEIPSLSVWIGAALIVLATAFTTLQGKPTA